MNQNVINIDKNNYTQIMNTARDLQRMYYIDKKNYFQQPYNKELRSVPLMEKNKARTRTFDWEQQSWLGCRNKHFKIGKKKNNFRWSKTRAIAKKKKTTCDEEEEHLRRRRAAGKNNWEDEEASTEKNKAGEK